MKMSEAGLSVATPHLDCCGDPDVIAAGRDAITDDQAAELAETFRLLADPGRLRMIAALLRAGEMCVCDLSEATGLTPTACSHNLRLLRGRRLARSRRAGRNVLYTLDDDHIRTLLSVALDHVDEG